MHPHTEVPSLARRIGVSALLGVVIAAGGVLIESALYQQPLLGFQSIDDVVIGLFAALVVFGYEQRRYRTVLNKLRVVAAMNHHVRNALQTISYAPYTEQEKEKQIKLIAESVTRIEWALREILPAEESAPDDLFARAHPTRAAEQAGRRRSVPCEGRDSGDRSSNLPEHG